MFNKNDPLIQSVQKVMEENNVRREAEKAVNEELGIFNKKALPFELHKLYDSLLEEVIQEALNEKLVGNQHKIDVNKNNRVDAHDFKLLRSKKKTEKKPEEHGVEAEREMASKGEKMYEAKKINEIGDTPAGKKAINRVALRGDAEIADQAIKKRPNKKVLKKAERAVDLSIATHKRRGGNVLGGYVKSAYGVKEEKIEEKAPPSDKAERMVKHIKKGYSKDGLTKKEKSIAYATAWKAYNKGKAKD